MEQKSFLILYWACVHPLGKTKKTVLHVHPQRFYGSKGNVNNQKIQGYLVSKILIEGWRGEHFSPHQIFEKSSKNKSILGNDFILKKSKFKLNTTRYQWVPVKG